MYEYPRDPLGNPLWTSISSLLLHSLTFGTSHTGIKRMWKYVSFNVSVYMYREANLVNVSQQRVHFYIKTIHFLSQCYGIKTRIPTRSKRQHQSHGKEDFSLDKRELIRFEIWQIIYPHWLNFIIMSAMVIRMWTSKLNSLRNDGWCFCWTKMSFIFFFLVFWWLLRSIRMGWSSYCWVKS